MAKQEVIESVSCNLRSVTQSCKGGVPLQRLERDYRDLLGTQIPYRDLGFSSLEAFLRTIPNVVSLKRGRDGLLMAEAVADSSTAHIASLISRQKQSKTVGRGTRRSGFSTRRGSFTAKYGSRGGRSSYSSYHSTSKFSGRTNKQDVRPSTVNHSKTSPLNFKIKIDNTNRISTETTQPKTIAEAPVPIVAPVRVKSAPTVSVRGYEVAPRFLRLHKRKVEAENHQQTTSPVPSQNSTTSTRNSATPPRTPSPLQYSIPPPSAPSISIPPPKQFQPRETSTAPSYGSFPSKTSTAVDGNGLYSSGNGLYSSHRKFPRPLRARLTMAKSSQQLDAAQTAKEYIEIYAKMNNISFEYSTKPIGQKKKNKGFVSNLNLGENKYLSYPDVAPTEEEAEEIAAKNAVTKIKESQVLPETPISNAEEIQTLLNRIEELVCEKPSGMFINGLQQEYENQFNEQLPSCWLDLLQQSSVVDIDEIEVSYGKVPEGANFIVRPGKGLSSGSTTPSEASGQVYTELHDSENDDTPREDSENSSYLSVPPLEIPVGNEWGVYVTNTSHFVAARLIDHDDQFLELQRDMSLFYDSYILPVQEVVEKRLYTTIGHCVEGDLVMHRVLANRILENDMVECYYVDEGSTNQINKNDLQELHEDFLRLPYQAIHFTLDGLEDYEPYLKQEHLEPLKNRTFIAIVKRWCSPYEEFLPDDPAIHKIIYSVVLYDTSDTETDICLNDTTIKESVSKSLICRLPKLNVSSQGYLTHVTTTGQIYLRFLHPERSWLEIELERLSPLFEDACLEPVNIPAGKICVAKFTDQRWYRVVVPEHPTSHKEPDMIEVIFVDYGNSSFVKKSEVCDLSLFNEFLSNLDYQAIKCELYNALPSPNSKWTDAAIQKLIELAPFNEELIVRVIVEGDANILPKVNLHKRIYTQGDSLIISINENLANKQELFLDLSAASSSNGPKVPSHLNLHRSTSHLVSKGSLTDYVPSIASPTENLCSLQNLEITSPCAIEWMLTPDNVRSPDEEDFSPTSLMPPEVPDRGEFFDVFVTMAATPHNFTVQALKSAKDLNELTANMQKFYALDENLIEMHPSLLKRNSFYAALHADNVWYRVQLVSPIGTLMAYYVDFGDFNEVRIQNLQKLYKPFRALPCQAIKASLAGVKPIEIDWNPVHCVKFKEMVTEKTFVARVQAHKNDAQASHLELILIDTSDPNKDVYIHEQLIANSMALPTNSENCV